MLLLSSQLALGQFIQQGPNLLGTPVEGAGQGQSVALSQDGNTAIMGGAGAAWVFTLSGGVWTQQGNRLVGTGAVGNALQGNSVSLSADGNTAIVGGPDDNGQNGATWVFTRSGGVWTQQGNNGCWCAISATRNYLKLHMPKTLNPLLCSLHAKTQKLCKRSARQVAVFRPHVWSANRPLMHSARPTRCPPRSTPTSPRAGAMPSIDGDAHTPSS
jgi:hypothetical protein